MNKKSIFVLGDSISIQYGPYLKKMLNGVFNYDRKRGEEQALADLDNPVGANGGDSSMVLDYLKKRYEDENLNYDILLLNCGLHDIKTDPQTHNKQIQLEVYKENLKETLKLMKKAGISVIWISTTPVVDEIHNSRMGQFKRYTEDLNAYNEAADNIMKEAGVSVIDLYTFTKNLGEDVFCDHVHFNENVRRMQAAFIAGYLGSMR
jgi:lysophospholipase L1-like esterase